jgi:hypothetical protein
MKTITKNILIGSTVVAIIVIGSLLYIKSTTPKVEDKTDSTIIQLPDTIKELVIDSVVKDSVINK